MRISKLILLSALLATTARGMAPQGPGEAPLIRGPGVSQAELETYAEAQARTTLAEQLDLDRPGDEMNERLKDLLERAQSAWLGGSIDSARTQFQSLTRLSLEADWREPQREAIHYAYLRLAQSAKSPRERASWLDGAVSAFPDLQADASAFPPPLIEEFRSLRSSRLGGARSVDIDSRFAEFRFLLINGRKFELRPGLKVRLPEGVFRVTLLSDATAPITARLNRRQLDEYHASLPLLAAGDCAKPSGAEPLAPFKSVGVLYASDCVRSRDLKGWLPKDVETDHAPSIWKPNAGEAPAISERDLDEKPASSLSKPWLWAGLAAALTGVLVIAFRESNRESPQPGPTDVKPVHREGL